MQSQISNDFIIQRESDLTTQNSSYDCFAIYQNEKFLINIKTNKFSNMSSSAKNNAIAAIDRLHIDYVLKDTMIKHFLVLKVDYLIKKEIIKILNVDGYFLEEIDFSEGYRSDSRNWSENSYKSISARLMVS